MFLLHYDPVTTELVLKNVPDPPVVANFTVLVLTSDLQLTTGTVVIDELMEVGDNVTMTIEDGAVLELI
jgi:hypothetical protein